MNRQHIVKTKKWTFPRDDQDNRIAGWFIDDAVYFVTPNVRGMGSLTLHTISPNGEVNPSVLVRGIGYDDQDAEYHEFVVLDGWDSRYEKRAGEELPVLR